MAAADSRCAWSSLTGFSLVGGPACRRRRGGRGDARAAATCLSRRRMPVEFQTLESWGGRWPAACCRSEATMMIAIPSSTAPRGPMVLRRAQRRLGARPATGRIATAPSMRPSAVRRRNARRTAAKSLAGCVIKTTDWRTAVEAERRVARGHLQLPAERRRQRHGGQFLVGVRVAAMPRCTRMQPRGLQRRNPSHGGRTAQSA